MSDKPLNPLIRHMSENPPRGYSVEASLSNPNSALLILNERGGDGQHVATVTVNPNTAAVTVVAGNDTNKLDKLDDRTNNIRHSTWARAVAAVQTLVGHEDVRTAAIENKPQRPMTFAALDKFANLAKGIKGAYAQAVEAAVAPATAAVGADVAQEKLLEVIRNNGVKLSSEACEAYKKMVMEERLYAGITRNLNKLMGHKVAEFIAWGRENKVPIESMMKLNFTEATREQIESGLHGGKVFASIDATNPSNASPEMLGGMAPSVNNVKGAGKQGNYLG